ncbi:hypothetical protein H257_16742 [Aphanomyces astaci]|uniref:RRM domain-containing protein n=1 Tax=Aphanomyces astaci TaxID=112090 RepID=W4FJB5_APHAT|nr:hypothetical protein H257_16742 [Aphanomyces astaci]ETV66939.1 hypothetical protein H257_16742 [Aphanomyces astaci]|eukprot:XP_009843580.1 hypothetical protein H257_16742 [Aphanomyces astaci]
MQCPAQVYPPNSRLFVVCGRLIGNEELDGLFSPFGNVVSVRIALDRSNKSRGFAFVQFTEATEAAAAIEKLHGAIVHGHTFKVSLAHASSPKGKKKEGGMMLPSGKRARDDRGDKTTHASKRTGAATVSSLHGTTSTPSPPTELQLVQSVLSDIVQQIVDMTVTSSLKPPSSTVSTSLKRKDSDADSSADTHTYNKRQTPVKPSSAHHHSRAAAVSDFLPRKMPKRPPPPPIFIRPPPPPCSTRLFVTSLYEYTHQELHAMFHVYGDFDHVQMVHCQGKLHTMAYVQYTKMSTAQYVVESFADDRSLLHVLFADETKQTSRIMLNWLHIGCTMPANMLTTIVSQCDGMEFIDIIPLSSGSATSGRCNVKFTNEAMARAAFGYLRTLPSILSLQLIPDPTSTYDVDIRAVENQFAHLMSTPYYPSICSAPPSSSTPTCAAPAVPGADDDDDLVWLHVTSPSPCTWSSIQSVVTPVPVLDLVVEGDNDDDGGARKSQTTSTTSTTSSNTCSPPPTTIDSTSDDIACSKSPFFNAWVQFGSAKHALAALRTLQQDTAPFVHVAVAPPMQRHAKKAKRWV